MSAMIKTTVSDVMRLTKFSALRAGEHGLAFDLDLSRLYRDYLEALNAHPRGLEHSASEDLIEASGAYIDAVEDKIESL